MDVTLDPIATHELKMLLLLSILNLPGAILMFPMYPTPGYVLLFISALYTVYRDERAFGSPSTIPLSTKLSSFIANASCLLITTLVLALIIFGVLNSHNPTELYFEFDGSTLTQKSSTKVSGFLTFFYHLFFSLFYMLSVRTLITFSGLVYRSLCWGFKYM